MKKEKPKWLVDIQDKSWEPELFISGGAIFFLLQLTDIIYKQGFLMLQETGFKETVIIADYLITAFNVLIFGFALHLSFRGFWVASICLSYVFPEGIRLEKMDYADKFKEKIKNIRDTVDLVILLETLCSLIFTLAFLFFTLIIGVLFTLIVLVPHTGLQDTLGVWGFMTIQIISFTVLGLGGVYMLDFLTLGYIKKQKKLAPFYYPIYWFFSILTFAPLYRSVYYTLVTNIKSWQVLLTIALYMGVGFGITRLTRDDIFLLNDINAYLKISIDESSHDLRYYEDHLEEGGLINQASIQSEIITENYVRLFIVHQKAIENLMDNQCQQGTNKAKLLDCYSNFYRIHINDKLQENVEWQHYEHPQTGEKGIISFIPIKDLETKKYRLRVILNVSSIKELKTIKEFGLEGATFAVIPFWKN